MYPTILPRYWGWFEGVDNGSSPPPPFPLPPYPSTPSSPLCPTSHLYTTINAIFDRRAGTSICCVCGVWRQPSIHFSPCLINMSFFTIEISLCRSSINKNCQMYYTLLWKSRSDLSIQDIVTWRFPLLKICLHILSSRFTLHSDLLISTTLPPRIEARISHNNFSAESTDSKSIWSLTRDTDFVCPQLRIVIRFCAWFLFLGSSIISLIGQSFYGLSTIESILLEQWNQIRHGTICIFVDITLESYTQKDCHSILRMGLHWSAVNFKIDDDVKLGQRSPWQGTLSDALTEEQERIDFLSYLKTNKEHHPRKKCKT